MKSDTNNIYETVSNYTNDRLAFKWVGHLYRMRKTIDDYYSDFNLIKDDIAKRVFRGKIDVLYDVVEGLVEDFEVVLNQYEYIVDRSGKYPVLFRGKIKQYSWINLCNIKVDNLPLNKDGLETTNLVTAGIPIPPIKLEEKGDGSYLLKDGRHRYLAFKLNGINHIPAYINQGKKYG